MPLFRGEITERLVQMAGTSFFGQAAPLSSPRGAAPTTPGAEDEEAELSTTQTFYHSLIIKQLIELGMSSLAQTAACHFIKELGNNYTRPLGPQLCKRIHNKPTEQASPTCPSQGAKHLEEETLNLSKEVQNMVDENAISRVCKEQEGFQS